MRHRDSRWDDYSRTNYHYDDRWYQQKRDRYPTNHNYNVGQPHRNVRSYSASDVPYGGYDRRYRPSSVHGYGYDSRDHPPRYSDSYPNDSYTVQLDPGHATRATAALKRFREKPRDLSPPPVSTRVPLVRKPTNNGLVTREPSTVVVRAISSGDVASRKAPPTVVRRLPDAISKTSSSTTVATESSEVVIPRVSTSKTLGAIQKVKPAVVHAKPLAKFEPPEKPSVVDKAQATAVTTRSTAVKSGNKVVLTQKPELAEVIAPVPVARRSNKHIPKAGSPVKVEKTQVPLKRTVRASTVEEVAEEAPETKNVTKVAVSTVVATKTRNTGDRIKSRANSQTVSAAPVDSESFVDAEGAFQLEDEPALILPHSRLQLASQPVQETPGLEAKQQGVNVPDTPVSKRKGTRKLTSASLTSDSTNVGSSATDVSDVGEASKKRVGRISKPRVIETREEYTVNDGSILTPSVEAAATGPLKSLKRTTSLKVEASEASEIVAAEGTLEATKKTKKTAASVAATKTKRIKKTSNDSLAKGSTRSILCKKYTRQAHDDYEADLKRAIEISMLETTLKQGEDALVTRESNELASAARIDDSILDDNLRNVSTNTLDEDAVAAGEKDKIFMDMPNGNSTLALPDVTDTDVVAVDMDADADADADADVEIEAEGDGDLEIEVEGVERKIAKRRGARSDKRRKGAGAVKGMTYASSLCSKRMQAVEEYLDWCERSYCGRSLLEETNTTNGHFGISNLAPEFGNVLDLLTCKFRQPHVLDLWGPKELVTFELAIFKYGKEFSEIQRLIPTKSVPEIVDLYYLWKKTGRYVMWKANRIY